MLIWLPIVLVPMNLLLAPRVHAVVRNSKRLSKMLQIVAFVKALQLALPRLAHQFHRRLPHFYRKYSVSYSV